MFLFLLGIKAKIGDDLEISTILPMTVTLWMLVIDLMSILTILLAVRVLELSSVPMAKMSCPILKLSAFDLLCLLSMKTVLLSNLTV